MQTTLNAQIDLLERQGARYLTGRVIALAASRFALLTVPVIGPFLSWLIGRWIGPVMLDLIKDGDSLAFAWNTARRVNLQTDRLDKAVDLRDQSQTEAELDKAEKDAIKSFDSVVRYDS